MKLALSRSQSHCEYRVERDARWKGRGLWSTNGDRTPWLKEGGKGSKPRAVHIQVRPDPLAH